MAQIEQLEAMTEAWDRLSLACDEAACCPTVKAAEVAVFRQMADSFKPAIDDIEKADGEGGRRRHGTPHCGFQRANRTSAETDEAVGGTQ